jgi:thioredoxin-like negative regulator of GroEL
LLAALPLGAVACHELGRAYARWTVDNTVLLGQRWLDAGRLDRAAEESARALALDSRRPEPWRLASELAWRQGRKVLALDDAGNAARVGGYAPGFVLPWAELALLASNPDLAERALAHLPPAERLSSARALRAAAEAAELRGDYRTARDRWAAAAAIAAAAKDPAARADEVRLAMALLVSGPASDRQRGLGLLARQSHAGDAWGRLALRVLLADSVRAKDFPAAMAWAEALRRHPLGTLEDLRACLQAASRAGDAPFRTLFPEVQATLSTSQLRSAELLGWLGQMGRTNEAAAWAQSINEADVTTPPLFVGVAEALRQASRWRDLENWATLADWGAGVGLLQKAYRGEALARLGEAGSAEARFLQLNDAAKGRGPEALLTAQLMYSWGQADRAVALLWVARQDPRTAVEALGMLVRHYQVKRDAAGLYQAFAAWHRLRPQDRLVATGFAFFGSVSGLGSLPECERITANLLRTDPADAPARCARAVALTMDGRPAEALDNLRSISADWRKSRAIAYAYGTALAAAGRPAEARAILRSIDSQELTVQQAARVAQALR